jgi:putative ATP-binding cassette transporter
MACYINRPHEPDSLLSPAAGGYWPVALRFWRGHGAVRAWLLTLMLIVFIMLQLALQYRMNLWSRDFFDAFGRREAATLRSQALLFMLLAGLSILVAIVLVWVRMTIQRTWRVWLTRLLIGRWLAHERFHRLRFPAGEDENPEYRIAEDVRVATDTPVNMVNGLFAAIIGAVVFIGILWNVGGDLSIEIYGRSLMVPKYLVISVVVYSAMLSLGMMLIGRGMMRVITGKNAAEAQFRAPASPPTAMAPRPAPGLTPRSVH